MHNIAYALYESLQIIEQNCYILTRKLYDLHWDKFI